MCTHNARFSPLCFNCYRRTIILKNFFQLNILSRRKLVFFLFEWKSFLHWFIAPSLFSTRRRNKRWWNNAQDRLVEYVIVISKRLMKVKCCFGSELKMASRCDSPLYRIFLILRKWQSPSSSIILILRNLYDYMIVFLTASFATIRNFFLSEFFSCERRMEEETSLLKKFLNYRQRSNCRNEVDNFSLTIRVLRKSILQTLALHSTR